MRLKEGRGHEKWAVKRERVMQIYARDHVEVHQQPKGSSLFVKKKERKNKQTNKQKQEQRNIMAINCEVLLQEFNKYPLFIYNNAMDQLVTV